MVDLENIVKDKSKDSIEEKIKYTSFYIRPTLDIEIPEININNNIYNDSIPSTPRPK